MKDFFSNLHSKKGLDKSAPREKFVHKRDSRTSVLPGGNQRDRRLPDKRLVTHSGGNVRTSFLLGVLLGLDDFLDSIVHFLHGLVLGESQAALV